MNIRPDDEPHGRVITVPGILSANLPPALPKLDRASCAVALGNGQPSNAGVTYRRQIGTVQPGQAHAGRPAFGRDHERSGDIMTTTADQPTTTAAEEGVRFRFTIQAGEFGAALRNVAPFASADDTLPVLTGVQLTVAADTIPGVPGSAAQPARREITLLSTDRYTLARQTLTIDASDVTGAGSVVLPKELVKSLAGKWRARNWELVSITAGDDDTITARDLDGNTSAARGLPGDFPRAGKMLDEFTPATDANEVGSMPSIAFNAKYVARFAKIGNGSEMVTFTVAADSVHDYAGYGNDRTSRTAKPVRWACGDATGLICAIRIPE